MEVKTCSKCKESKELSQFSKNKKSKDGLSYHCKLCVKLNCAEHYKNNKEKIISRTTEWTKNNKAKHKKFIKNWRISNKEKEYNTKRLWREQNREKVLEYYRTANSKRLPKKLEYAKKRELKIINATPENEQILRILKDIYDNCPKGMVIDHYYPIQGKLVSGLNVPWNIQYLTKSENMSKSNKMPTEPIKDNLPERIKADIARFLRKV